MEFNAPVSFKVIRSEKNLRIVSVASQGDAAKFASACKKADMQAQFRKGKTEASKHLWFVRVWK
jgi:hypothetical protein